MQIPTRRSARPIVGLEIDPGAISAAEVVVDGSLVVKRAAVIALHPGVIRDGEVADPASLTEALKAMWLENKGLGRRVRVGIANQRIVMRWVELPPIDDAKQLDAAVRFAAQDAVPMPLTTAVLDWQSAGIIETPGGPKLRALVVAARRDMVERVLGSVRDAGLRVDGIDLSAFGMMRAIAQPEDGSAVYLSVGGMSNLSVADAGMCLFTRTSSGGLESIAVDLAERRGLTIDHARAWLGHVGVETPLQEIEGDRGIVADTRDALLAGIHRISSEVRTSLEFHQMQNEASITAPVEKIVLTGAALAIQGMSDAIGDQLSLSVEERVIAVDTERMSLAPGAVTVAAGLAVQELAA